MVVLSCGGVELWLVVALLRCCVVALLLLWC